MVRPLKPMPTLPSSDRAARGAVREPPLPLAFTAISIGDQPKRNPTQHGLPAENQATAVRYDGFSVDFSAGKDLQVAHLQLYYVARTGTALGMVVAAGTASRVVVLA